MLHRLRGIASFLPKDISKRVQYMTGTEVAFYPTNLSVVWDNPSQVYASFCMTHSNVLVHETLLYTKGHFSRSSRLGDYHLPKVHPLTCVHLGRIVPYAVCMYICTYI